MEIKNLLKASVAVGALLALAAPVDAVAGGKVSANNSKTDLTIGGRVHRTIHYIDDGEHDAVFQGAGISSNSEMWLTGSGKLTESVTMGAYMRWDMPKNQATHSFNSSTGAATTADASQGANDKYEYIYFKHASMGTLSMGDIEPGADGTMESNYMGVAGKDGAALSSVRVRTNANADFGALATAFVGTIDPGADANRVRYDSAKFSGFSVHGDLEYGGGGSVGAKYSGTVAGLTLKAGIGYEADGGGTDMQGASVAVKHSSGLHLALNYGEQNVDASTADPEWWRIAGGYDAKMNSLGNTNFTVAYSEKEDETVKGYKGEMLQVAVKQSLDAVGGAIVLQYDNYSFSDAANTGLKDIDAVVLETSFNF